MKNPKMIGIVVVAAIAVLGGAYKFVLAKPPAEAAATHKPKVEGTVYVLGKEFLVNLADGRFAKFTVALLLDHEDHSTEPLPGAGGGHGAAPKPPAGYGAMHQEALVRDIIVEQLTGTPDNALIESAGRQALKKSILKAIAKKTDVKVDEVLLTDITVQ